MHIDAHAAIKQAELCPGNGAEFGDLFFCEFFIDQVAGFFFFCSGGHFFWYFIFLFCWMEKQRCHLSVCV
ncbi:hypothetical protein A3730_19505 [Alcanivorax sp. HI0044]|uniref:hypothetical protein n=1 Tax=Alcanivorax sp. HI0044 TaxID=1822234 RepID=UPI0007B8B957|nr:hypothetical protein [Alcanivorax sp. HI0044]KZY31352.1 hypothetical protein A3730_19505 [Alcanivorax sp. HI0044]